MTAIPLAGVRQEAAWRRLAYRTGGVIVALLLWQLVASSSVLASKFGGGFSPMNTAPALLRFVTGGGLSRHAVPSLFRVGVGLSIAVVVGVPLGLLIGTFPKFNLASNTVFQFIRMTSPLAWMPVAIILLGIGDRPVYFLITMAAVWPIVINTAHGVRTINPGWVDVVKMLGGDRTAVIRRAIIPGIVPDILTGVRVAIGVAWIVLVPAEMLGVPSGLGYYLLDTRDRFAYGELMAGILVIGFFGFLSDSIVRWCYRRFSWRPDPDTEAFAP